MTSFSLSLSRAERMASRRGMENLESGKRYDVMITYCTF